MADTSKLSAVLCAPCSELAPPPHVRTHDMTTSGMAILRGTFRLSIVVALLTAVYVAYQDWMVSIERNNEDHEILRTLRCGSRMSDDALRLTVNEFGLIDLGKTGCANKRFLASFEEIRKTRDGTMEQPKAPTISTTLVANYAIQSFIVVIVVNLLGLGFLGARAVFRWVVNGFRSNLTS
jgi:hypothetical protein